MKLFSFSFLRLDSIGDFNLVIPKLLIEFLVLKFEMLDVVLKMRSFLEFSENLRLA